MRPLLSLLGSRVQEAPVAARSGVASMMMAVVPPTWAWYDVAIAGYLGLSAVSLALKPEEVAKATPWSKWSIGYRFKTPCSARTAMLVKYIPAFCLAGWWAVTAGGGGEALMPFLMAAHFGKRIAEVVGVQDFSGSPTEELYASGLIALFYAFVAWLEMRSGPGAVPAIASAGLATFAVGQAGNFYHHHVLSQLRKRNGYGKYHIPEGGLFGLVGCPHYLFEIISWIGAAMVAQSAHAWLVAFWVAGMLGGRATVTTAWYRDKFGPEYPSDRKHIVPFVF